MTASDLLRLPEVVNLRRVLDRDKSVATAAEAIIQKWAEKEWENHVHHGDRIQVGDFEQVNDEAYGTMLLTDYTRNLGSTTEKALQAAVAAVMAVDSSIRDEDDAYEALDLVVRDYLDKHFDENAIEQIASHTWEEARDAMEYDRDPYSYYGVSRRDFMAGDTVRARTARLAVSLPVDSPFRRRLATLLHQDSR